jgi:hypothetical protein
VPIFTKGSIRILFIHIPKTGGSSVETVFKRAGFELSLFSLTDFTDGCSPQHFHREILLRKIEREAFDAVFTIVRDPTSRIVSEYNFRMKKRAKSNLPKTPLSQWIKAVFSAYETNNFLHDNHIRPQNEFILPRTQVYYYEHGLSHAVAGVLAGIDLNATKTAFGLMPRTQISTDDAEKSNTLSIDDHILIRRFYREDYDRLGYPLERGGYANPLTGFSGRSKLPWIAQPPPFGFNLIKNALFFFYKRA